MIDGIKREIGINIDGIKINMRLLNDYLKEYVETMMNVKIEGLKEGLAKFLEEMLPIGYKVIHKNHEGEHII